MGDSDLKTFSGRLKELRKSLNLTQAEFVKDIDITAAALSAYEKNLKTPRLESLKESPVNTMYPSTGFAAYPTKNLGATK